MPPGNTSLFERQEKSMRKHKPFNSGASRAVPPPPVQRPGWKGPAFIKKAAKPERAQPVTTSSTANIQPQLLPLDLQQLILNIFRATFPSLQDPDALRPVLHDVNAALGERDLEKAFGTEERCEAYVLRWSPSRVLGYANILAWLVEECGDEEWVLKFLGKEALGNKEVASASPVKVVCLGGGVSEIMAFAALLRLLRLESHGQPASAKEPEGLMESLQISGTHRAMLDIHLVNRAPWENVITKIESRLTTPPELSKYASATARASNASFLHGRALNLDFTQTNVLGLDNEKLRGLIGDGPVLVTLFLTLNELYNTDTVKATKLLSSLSAACQKDALLCVIDGFNCTSEAIVSKSDVGEEERKTYPMHWLMDRALLGDVKGKGENSGLWEKIVVDESRWSKLEKSLKYPISLENIRFQVHLFRRRG